MRTYLALAGLALLAGCATPSPQHVAALNAFVGKTEADVVRVYGVPVRSVETGGSKFIAYSDHHIESFPDYPAFGGYGWGGGWGWGGGFGGYGGGDIQEFNCETTFEMQADIVKRQAADGNERCWTGTRHYAVLPAAIQAAFNVD